MKLAEVSRHCGAIVRDEKASIACGESENFLIRHACQTGCQGGSEVDGRLVPYYGRYDDLI